MSPQAAFGNSLFRRLDLSRLVERFQSRFQQIKVDPPDTEAVVEFILRWRIGKKVADHDRRRDVG